MTTAIIGGGINGLYLAWKLAEMGQEITVFERKTKIGKQVCSGLFSERILEFVPQSKKLIQNQIQSVLIHFPKRTLRVEFSRNFFVMSHFELDNLVADSAKMAGAKILLQQNISSSNVEQMEKEFDRIIGCDGYDSAVRKYLGLKNPDFRFTIQGFLAKKDSSNYVETWPQKPGFIWKIPRGTETEYGIISYPKSAKPLFDEFLSKNNLQLERIQSSIIPQGFITPSHSSITLCGDAAGLTKSWSGGGVVWGLLAASILLKNFPDFLKYKNKVKKFFLPKIILSRIATKMVYFLGFHFPWFLPKNVKIEGDFLL